MNVAETLTARLIGTVFVERGLLSESQIRVALEIQRETGQQLGQVLVERFGVSRQELASVVAEQWAELGRSGVDQDPAANESWRRLGDIFVERGFVTPEELEQALQRQRETGERVGEALVAQGSISKFELAGALAEQASVLEEGDAPAAAPDATVVPLSPRIEQYLARVEPATEPRPLLEPVLEADPVQEIEPVLDVEPAYEGVFVPEVEVASTVEPVSAHGVDVQPVLEVEPAYEPEPLDEAWSVHEPEAEYEPVQDDEPEAAPESSAAPASVVTSLPIVVVQADAQPSFGWVAFASTTTGYRLFQLTGAIPAVGTTVDVPELGERVVLRLGCSPLWQDRRTCVYLEQLAPEPALAS